MQMKLLLGLGLILAGSTHASEIRRAEALQRTQVVVDHGVLTASSKDSVFRHDIVSGEISILYADGSRYVASTQPASAKEIAFFDEAGFLWVNPYGAGESVSLKSGDACSGETNTLVSAINLVSAACQSGGNSEVCASALTTASRAFRSWFDCMTRLFEQMK